MTNNTAPALLGQRTQVDVRAIEHELNELWKQAAAGENGEGGEKRHAVTRTCVLNLVVVTSGGPATDRANETVAKLMARYPNRAIVISAVPDAAGVQPAVPLLDAWAQAHCQMPSPGRPLVCGEQITIEARGTAVDRVPSTVLSLLVPQVPVMLWWPRGAPFDDQRFNKFDSLLDRVIVDSATFAAPEAGLAHMAAQIAAGIRVSDLSWSRLTPWRELVAQFFDAPALIAHLAEITRVTVDYEASPGAATDRSQALLLVGWLAARLGWRAAGPLVEQPGVTTLRMAGSSGGEIAAELRPAEPKDDLLDRLAALTIECRRARFSVARDDAPDCAVARSEVEGMQPLVRKVRLEHLDEAGLIGEELRLLGRDRTFEDVLRVAATLVSR